MDAGAGDRQPRAADWLRCLWTERAGNLRCHELQEFYVMVTAKLYPVLVDEELTLGRVDAVMLADGTAVVSYMVYVGGEGALRLRTLRADGSRGEPMVLTGISPSRSSGIPRLVRLTGDRLAAAWTEAGTSLKVRVALIPLGAGRE